MGYLRTKQQFSAISCIEQADTIGSGRVTVTTSGTPVQFPDQACLWVIVTGETDNTNPVVIGGSDVVASLSSRKGIPLYAAQGQIFFVKNLNVLYMDAVTNGEGVTYTYGN